MGLTLPRSLLAVALVGVGFAAGFVLAPRHGDRGEGGALPIVEQIHRVSVVGLTEVGRLPRLANAKSVPPSSTPNPSGSPNAGPQPQPLPQPSRPQPSPTPTTTQPQPPDFQHHSGTGTTP